VYTATLMRTESDVFLGAVYSFECLQLGTALWETLLCTQPLSRARNQTYFSVPYTAASVQLRTSARETLL
jgi:hypothetical protein